jgi:general secretion pathway protein M
MKDTLIQAWRSRAPRERLVLAGGSALLLLALLYAYVWLPMQRDVAHLRQALPELREQARQLERDAQEVARLKKQPALGQAKDNLAGTVENAALANGLRERIESITPQGAGKAKVVLPQVAFDAWIALLGELQASHGVRVESTRIQAGEEAGMVSVEAVLVAGG